MLRRFYPGLLIPVETTSVEAGPTLPMTRRVNMSSKARQRRNSFAHIDLAMRYLEIASAVV